MLEEKTLSSLGEMLQLSVGRVARVEFYDNGSDGHTIDDFSFGQVLPAQVIVRVEDGRGGVDEQQFAINVAEPGTISGRVFDDGQVVETTAYFQDFEDPNNPLNEWSLPLTTVTPNGGRRFLGEFAKQSTVLNLSDLPEHDSLKLSFDLFVIRSWDGNGFSGEDPDVVTISVDGGLTLLSTTFSNNSGLAQAFPDMFPGGITHPGKTGAVESDTLGFLYNNSFVWDAVYHVEFEFEHASASLPLRFTSSGATSNDILNESWGIDNVRVTYPGKTGLSDRVIYLDQDRNGRRDDGELFSTTDTAGEYSFVDLAPGEYVVAQELPTGWLQTAPNTGRHIITVGNGEAVEGIDFGSVQAPADHENESPQFVTSPGPSPSATVSELFRYDAWAFDPEGDPLTFSLYNAPNGMVVDAETGIVVWIPTTDQVSTHDVVLRVDDGNDGVTLQSFQVTVSLPNAPPVVTSTPAGPATVLLPYEYQIVAQDAEGDPLTYQFAQGFTPPAGMNLSSTGLLTWTPTGEIAAQQVIVQVNAQNGPDTTYTFTLTAVATSTNRSPEIRSDPRTSARVGQIYVYLVDAFDPDGDPLSYMLDAAPTGMTIGKNADGSQSTMRGLILWTPTSADFGQPDPTVRIIVSDGRGGTATKEFSIHVTAAGENASPTIVSTPPSLATTAGRSYEYNLRADDPDGDPVVWSLVQGPSGMSIDPIYGTLRWTPGERDVRAHQIVVRAEDPYQTSDEQTFTLVVSCANLPPAIISRPPTQAYKDSPYIYAVRATDPERDDLDFFLISKPDGMTIDEDTGLIRWTPMTADAGRSIPITIEVHDETGGVGKQVFSIEVAATPPNKPPVITSAARMLAPAGGVYEYQPTARDPEGDAVTFSLLEDNKPVGMTITGGLIHWDVPADLTGRQPPITVVATDAAGNKTLQTFSITVQINHTPTLDAIPNQSATQASTFRYDVHADDSDGDLLTYSIDGPTGIAIDRFGRIESQVPAGATGNEPIIVTVTDPQGLAASQTFNLAIDADTQAPLVNLRVGTGNSVILNELIRFDQNTNAFFLTSATDNLGVTEVTLELVQLAGGQREILTLDASGRATKIFTAGGQYEVVLTAHDAAGNVGQATRRINIVDPNSAGVSIDITGPQEIVSPDTYATISTAIDVSAEIKALSPGGLLDYYQVFYARAQDVNPGAWDLSDPDLHKLVEAQFAPGTSQFAGTVATFDPTVLANDAYVILVVAYDISGTGWAEPRFVNVDGNLKLGNFRLEFIDLSLPIAGIPITITRVYDTLQADVSGDFGYGWSLGVRDAKIRETVPPGPGQALFSEANPLIPGKSKIYLTNPDGQRVGFTFDVELHSGGFFAANYRPVYKPDPGVYDKLESDGLITEGLFGFSDYNPDEYTLTTKDGTKYRYNQFTGLQSITDTANNTLEFRSDGIYRGSMAVVSFHRDHRGRIDRISYQGTDAAGNPQTHELLYTYNVAGDLATFTDQVKLDTTYGYLPARPHYLDQITDPLGRVAVKTVYDAEGRIQSVTDAEGNTVLYDHSLEDIERIYDAQFPDKSVFTDLKYDKFGNVLEERRGGRIPVGGTNPVYDSIVQYRYIYERDQNELSPNRDREWMVTQIFLDADGNEIPGKSTTTTYDYDSSGNVTKVIDTVNGQTMTREFSYDSRSNVKRVKDELGRETFFNYDAHGNLKEVINATGEKSGITYDSQRRPETYTDFRGAVTTFVYDGNESQPSEIRNPGHSDARPNVRKFEYSTLGQVTKLTDEEGIVTEYRYDNQGRLIFERIGADAPVEYQYTGHLQTKRIVQRSLVEPGKTDIVTEFGYWANDLLRFEIDALGAVTGYEYDANGNRTFLGRWDTKADYDADYAAAAANESTFFAGRYPNATFEHVFVYDRLGRLDFELDDVQLDLAEQAGIMLDQITVKLDYDYDSAGNRTQIIDRNGRVRTFGYDERNRLIQELWFESIVDTTPDRSFTWTYCTCGNITEAAEYAGAPGTSEILSKYTYTYDTLNRLKTVDNAGTKDMPNVVLSYDYDENGNRILVEDDLGVAVESTYDDRNRLDTRSWANAGATQAIDEVLVDFDYYRNGLEKEIKRYDVDDMTGAMTLAGRTLYGNLDASGRVRLISHRDATDQAIAEYTYGFDKLGLVGSLFYNNRDDQYDFDVLYGYDDLGQLTGADYSNATTARGIYTDESYNYDKNGNRTASYLHGTGYDTGTGNQLLSDGTFNYEYDNEGNLRFKRTIGAESTDFTEYRFDHRNRLTEVEIREPGKVTLVKYTYDMDGRRIGIEVREGIDSPTIITSVTRMVYDGDHVWADFTDAGVIAGRYLHGDNLDQILVRSQLFSPSSGIAWYLTDQLGSVNDLINTLGASINHAAYSSFGNSLAETNDAEGDRYGFTGREHDITANVYYYRARYYSQSTGQFVSADPIHFISGDVNQYRYVTNSVTRGTDPLGLFSLPSYATLLTVGFGALFGAQGVRSQGGDAYQITVGAGIGAVFGLVGGGLGIFASDIVGQIIGGAFSPQPIEQLDFNEWSTGAALALFVVPEVTGITVLTNEQALAGLMSVLAAEAANKNLPFDGPHEKLYQAIVRGVRLIRERLGGI
jgi:RHS repeat-associated protein